MKDYMVRATAANAQIRAFACTTRETVETARAAHNTSPVVTAALGRLLSAGVMMGSMLKGDDELITLQIKGDGPIGGLTVTADRNGHVKGYANVPDVMLPPNSQGKLDVGGAIGVGLLRVIKDMGLKIILSTNANEIFINSLLYRISNNTIDEIVYLNNSKAIYSVLSKNNIDIKNYFNISESTLKDTNSLQAFVYS